MAAEIAQHQKALFTVVGYGVGGVIGVLAGGAVVEAWGYEALFGVAAARIALADEPVDLDWFTTREREHAEVLPWDHLDSGLDREWLWQDWQDALDEEGVEDCRWTPCFDCGVCDQMGTSIQVGPTDLGLPEIRVGQPA